MSGSGRQSQQFFERRYREQADPWQFASNPYELSRYTATLNALRAPRYGNAYEPGCSVGVLTAELAKRCDRLIACDIAPTAVRQARERCETLAHVEISVGDVDGIPTAAAFDLIVFSEIGYYFDLERLRAVGRNLAAHLAPDGELVAVHWLGESEDHVLHGDQVHETLAATLPCPWIGGSRHPGFRIDSWRQAA